MYKYFLLLLPFLSFGQTQQDLFIRDSIKTPYYTIENRTEAYYYAKKNILKLEETVGFYADLRQMIFSDMYQNGDLDLFRSTLEELVKTYGFHVAYMKGDEPYYNALIKNELADWFKPMYLKNHLIWLEANWDKQVDMRVLNELNTRDQLVNGYAATIHSMPELTAAAKTKVLEYLSEYYWDNATDLLKITRKHQAFPTAKSFGLIQNNFGVAIIHNIQSTYTYDKYVEYFISYYKEAYLRGEIDYTIFKNIDNYSYVHHKNSIFGLLKADEIPPIYKQPEGEIPIRDPKKLDEYRREFNWL